MSPASLMSKSVKEWKESELAKIATRAKEIGFESELNKLLDLIYREDEAYLNRHR